MHAYTGYDFDAAVLLLLGRFVIHEKQLVVVSRAERHRLLGPGTALATQVLEWRTQNLS